MAPTDLTSYFQTLLDSVPGLQTATVTDSEGVNVLQVRRQGAKLNASSSLLDTATMAAEQASKMGFGAAQRIAVQYDTFQVVHFCVGPLIVTLVAENTANTGAILGLAGTLDEAIGPLADAIAAQSV